METYWESEDLSTDLANGWLLGSLIGCLVPSKAIATACPFLTNTFEHVTTLASLKNGSLICDLLAPRVEMSSSCCLIFW